MQLPDFEKKQQYIISMQLQEQQYNQMVQEAQMQGQEPPPPPPIDKEDQKLYQQTTWEEIKKFLEDNRLRSYMMDMETTFNVWEDEQEEIKSRLDYLKTLNESIQQAITISQSNPMYLELILKNTSWALSAFPRSRSVQNETDEIIAEILEQNRQAMENPPPQEPTPEQLIAQSGVMTAQADGMNAETKRKLAEIQARKVEIEGVKVAGELDIDKNKLMLDAQKAANEQQRTVEESFNKINTTY